MKVLHLLSFFIFFFFIFAISVFAQTFPKPQGYVNDFADLYSASFEKELESDLTTLESSTSAEIAVVTVDTLQDTPIEDYAVKLFENWKIGKRGKDNGVLLLISKGDKEARIEVGYGLEPVITDARAKRIIENQMIPEFRANNYEKGTRDAVSVIKKYIRGETVVEETPKKTPNWSGFFELIPFLFFGLIYLGSFLARSKDYYAGGIVGGVIGLIIGLIVGSILATLLSAFALSMIGLLLDYILSKNYERLKSQHKRTDWWGSRGGFYGGGRSSGGGGFGGFGGGSSGGGGASGRW